jgi:predicted DNA-binding protein
VIEQQDPPKPKETRTKRISEAGEARAINFKPSKEQREKFDAIQKRTRRTQSDLAREALDDFLKKYEQESV